MGGRFLRVGQANAVLLENHFIQCLGLGEQTLGRLGLKLGRKVVFG